MDNADALPNKNIQPSILYNNHQQKTVDVYHISDI